MNQWAFVSYHHLLTDLETVVLDLLCRLYGPQWALHSTITTATTTETKDIVAESSSIAEDLQDFKTYLRAEQVKASECNNVIAFCSNYQVTQYC